MNVAENTSYDWPDGDIPVLKYRVWAIFERKISSFFLLATTLLLTYQVWLSLGAIYIAVVVFLLLLSMFRRCFFPIHYEMNAEGISRWLFGIKQYLAWNDILSYDVLDNGMMIYRQKDRYFLAPFRGRFVPVPKHLHREVEARFRFFAGRPYGSFD